MSFVSPKVATSLIKSHDNVFIHSGVSAPQLLIQGMIDRSADISGVNIFQLHTEGNCSYAKKEFAGSFTINNFFNGENMRHSCDSLTQNYIPIFLSEIPSLFYKKIIDLDVALVQISPPDSHGMCSLGASIDIAISAVRTAKKIIAQINPKVPRTFGDSQIHISKIDAAVECHDPLYQIKPGVLSEVEKKIGQNVASLIEDGSTLQMGIGAIPNAVLKCLEAHKDLGIHTEMFSDGVVDLYRKGVITGRMKKKHPGKMAAAC
jgi:acyl-CoA hydrolase